MSMNSTDTANFTSGNKMSAPPALSKLDGFLLRWRAKGFLFFGMRTQAADVFREILARSPEDVHALNSLGYDALTTGHPAQALPYFEKALALAPEDQQLLTFKEFVTNNDPAAPRRGGR